MNYLINGIEKIINENIISFHMPGHKNNKKVLRKYLKNLDLIDIDLTEIPGTDNLHDAKNIIKNSHKRLSNIYKSYKSYFLVNGSTSGILTAILASTNKGDKILVNRNAHKSVINAIFLNELDPLYINPIIDKSGLVLGIDKEELKEKLNDNDDIKVVVITYPTYDGICFDIDKIVKIVKKYNKILIVDEAHGSHFIMSSKFPKSACLTKTDVVIQSVHKNSLGFTQGAYLHLNNSLLEVEIEKYLEIFQTSSPSYIIMSSLDANINFFIEEGKEKANYLFKNIDIFNKKIKKTEFKLLNMGIDIKEVVDIDKSKIVVSGLELGIDGKILEKILRKEYHIQIEYSTYNYILAIATIFNKKEDFKQFADALIDIEKKYKDEKKEYKKPLILKNTIVKYKPSDVEKKSFMKINIEDALNKVSLEKIIPYPPGIPLLNPGEVITNEVIEKVKFIKKNIKVIGGKNEKRNNRVD